MADPKDEITNNVFSLRHKALRNALYHTARRQWLERWSRIFNFLIIILGTAAAATIIQKLEFLNQLIPILIACIGALQLVYDFSGRAKDHAFLQSRYYGVMANIDACIKHSEGKCALWEAEFSQVAADSPPVMRALDAVADNQATSALLGGDARLKVTWFEWVTRNMLAHNNSSFSELPDWKTLEAPELNIKE